LVTSDDLTSAEDELERVASARRVELLAVGEGAGVMNSDGFAFILRRSAEIIPFGWFVHSIAGFGGDN
jgi:hypothetical protein